MTQYEELMSILKTISSDNDQCVLWHHPKDWTGYARVRKNTKRYRIHRLALEYKLKRSISKGLYALHSCDNPSCFNPNHLEEGTLNKNIEDMWKRNRNTMSQKLPPMPGSKNKLSKLTEVDVVEIRQQLNLGVMGKILAQKYNVSPQAITYVRKHGWKHIN